MSTYTPHKTWLEKVCGPVNGPVPNFSDGADFAARNQLLDAVMDGIQKDDIRNELRDINLTGKEKISIPFLADPTAVSRPMDKEYDAHGDRASVLKKMQTSDGEVNLDSAEAGEKLNNIQRLLEPIFERSRTLAAELDAEGNRVFSDRDIEKELWSPLVREGVIPSNIVPDAFSETTQVFKQGTAVYEELMDREDGRAMSPDGIAVALRMARHTVKIGKLVGSEALRYVDVSIQEASRQDFAKFAAAKNKLSFDEHTLPDSDKLAELDGMSAEDIVATGELPGPPTEENLAAFREAKFEEYLAGREVDMDSLRAQQQDLMNLENIGSPGAGGSGFDSQLAEMAAERKTSVRPLDLIRDDFDDQASGEGGNVDYAGWLGDEEKRLTDELAEGGGNTDALTARLNAVQGAKLTHEFADHLQHQAALSIASTIADTSLQTIERARDKRQRRDAVEGVLTGLVDLIGPAVTLGQDTDDLTLDGAVIQMQHDVKYGSLAAKGAIRGVKKMCDAMDAAGTGDTAEMRTALFGVVADFLDAVGEGVAMTGSNAGGTMDIDGDGDGRDDAATYALIGKSAGIAARTVDRMIQVIQNGGSKLDVASIALTAVVGGAVTPFTGMIGDETRANRDLEDIPVGMGDDGLDPENNVLFATNPFEEVHGAGGQTDFGMSGDLATVADQRAALADTDDLIDDLRDASKAAVAAPKIKSRLEQTAALGDQLPGFADGDLLRELMLIEDPQTLQDRADDIRRVMDGIARASSQAEDTALVARLSDDVNKDHMNAELEELRDMLDDPENMDDAAALAHFKAIRDEMLKDERVLSSFQDDLAREDAELEALKARADLTRLDTIDNPEEYARERDAALGAIQELTQALKAAQKKAKMLDTALKTGLGVVLASVPGAGLAQKIRALVMDVIKAKKRANDLSIWKGQMEAMSGNYSVYEYAASGERQVLRAGEVHDVLEVVADGAGVLAETLRLIDHTHLGAAGLTTFEKSLRVLNEIWFVEYSEARIRNGWKAFTEAVADRGDRRKARKAMEMNTTFAKCVLAYGACIDGNAQARTAMQACGLTPEVLANDRDVCQAVVDYLRTRLADSEFETIADHDTGDWLPCPVTPTIKNWTMIKAAALKLIPALDKGTFASPDLDRALVGFAASPDEDTAKAVKAGLDGYHPKDATGKPHDKMMIVVKTMAIALRQYLPPAPKPERAAQQAAPADGAQEEFRDALDAPKDEPEFRDALDAPPISQSQHAEYLAQIKAADDLKKNNCLINAIALSAHNRNATEEELVMIRSQLNNVGKMLVAEQKTVDVIKAALKISNKIQVYYEHAAQFPPDTLAGTDPILDISHANAHFTPGRPE